MKTHADYKGLTIALILQGWVFLHKDNNEKKMPQTTLAEYFARNLGQNPVQVSTKILTFVWDPTGCRMVCPHERMEELTTRLRP